MKKRADTKSAQKSILLQLLDLTSWALRTCRVLFTSSSNYTNVYRFSQVQLYSTKRFSKLGEASVCEAEPHEPVL